MLSLTLRALLRQPSRPGPLLLGLVTVVAGSLLIAEASISTSVAADKDLGRYWRTTYDILVRPEGARTQAEKDHGLVEANHLSGIPGSISLEQYQRIREIPGIEVAAPIAMIGYVEERVPAANLGHLTEPGLYALESQLIVNDGIHSVRRPYSSSWYLVDRDLTSPQERIPGLNVNAVRPVEPEAQIPLLLAGIDPEQEAALVKLEEALLAGKYLATGQPIHTRVGVDPFGDPINYLGIPVLINATPYVDFALLAQLKELDVAEHLSLEELRLKGGSRFLASLSGPIVKEVRVGSEELYRRLLDNLLNLPQLTVGPMGPEPRRLHPPAEQDRIGGFVTYHALAYSVPSRIEYRSIDPPFDHRGPVLQIVLPSQDRNVPSGGDPIRYRKSIDPWRSEDARFQATFSISPVGVFDIEAVPRPADVNRVPLETYFPPVATLRYAEDGRPVVPITVRPTLNPHGYLPSPPLLLTTLEAACLLLGEQCISAIRVRVAGVDELTPTAQSKIEAVASEILRATGLTVDVMVGSSPQRVLVQVPGVGYVEEQWVKKNVTTHYGRQIQLGHWLLLAALGLITALYVLDLTWGAIAANRHRFALEKALGWRSRTVFGQVILETGIVSLSAVLVGASLGAATGPRIELEQLGIGHLVTVLALAFTLSLFAAIMPAWLAVKVPPIRDMQMRAVYASKLPPVLLGRFSGLVFRDLVRGWPRLLPSLLTAALSAALLVLLLGVISERRSYLTGTLLGEYVLIRIQGYHLAISGIGFALALGATMSAFMSRVLERKREIGLLKAMGWRTATIASQLVAQGLIVGALGGAIGTAIGLATYGLAYGSLPLGWLPLAGIGAIVPLASSALAVAYPSWFAIRHLPAQSLRVEA